MNKIGSSKKGYVLLYVILTIILATLLASALYTSVFLINRLFMQQQNIKLANYVAVSGAEYAFYIIKSGHYPVPAAAGNWVKTTWPCNGVNDPTGGNPPGVNETVNKMSNLDILEKLMKTIKGLTLTELILTLVLSAVLLFGAIQLIVSHTKFTTTLQTGISLSQEAVVVVEHIVANVRNSQYVTIGANSLNLYNVSTTVPIGTYTWSGSDLNYTPQGQAASLVSNKIDQDNPPLFSDPFTPSNTQTKVLHMAVNTKDSRFPNIGPKSSTTTVYCRIPGPPVRLWGLNLAGTMGVKGYFSNIQDAINSTDCADGDTVQIGFNGRAPYKENVTNLVGSTYKNISLQGSFDDYGQQHLRDPAFETIIQGVQTYLGQPSAPTVTFEIQTPLVQSVSIRGFTIINGEDGIRVWTDSADMSGHVLDVCDNIVKQNGRTDSFCAGIDSASGHIVIRNNTVTANQGVGITSADGNIVANNSVTSNLGSNDGGGINVGTSGIAGLSGCVVSNNTIQYNQALHGGGVFAHAGGGVLTITNNNISYNTASSGLPLVTGGGGI
ncbi:MAG: right-handed parallel beta-helix repeat-containing protein, partial [Candidatus Omnitrophica bacterium]|nr:right-handed parallel beta-helix repeat-containing protein [Candidatus Omnitrophota bacterium]